MDVFFFFYLKSVVCLLTFPEVFPTQTQTQMHMKYIQKQVFIVRTVENLNILLRNTEIWKYINDICSLFIKRTV